MTPKVSWRSVFSNYPTVIASLMVAITLFVCISVLRNERSAREKALAREVDVLRYEACTTSAENRLILRALIETSGESFTPEAFESFQRLPANVQNFFLEIAGDTGATKKLLAQVPLPVCPEKPKNYTPTDARPTTTSIKGVPTSPPTTSAGSPPTTKD